MSSFDASNYPIEQWAIEKLLPYEQNHKKHPKEHVESLASSIEEFGVEHPIAVEEDGTIISGHGRRLALLSLDRKFAPVRVFKGITKAQAQKLRIAANKTTSNDYDTDILSKELKAILGEGMDLTGVGLTEKEEKMLLEDIGEIDFGVMTDDISEDITSHEDEIIESAKKAEEKEIPISKAFGFKTIPASYARIVTRFMGIAEENYKNLSPFEAMAAQMQRLIDDAA